MLSNWLTISSILALSLAQILEFDPPTLNIQDAILNNKFKFRLKEKQDKPVQVFFEAPGVTFSKCSVEIGVDDFNQYKEIEISTVPVFDKRKDVDVIIRARVYNGENKTDQDYKCKRIFAPGGTCSSVGDPHYSLYNKVSTTHMGDGIFHLFHHEFFSIQATQGKCFSNTPTCNQAIAVRYGSSILALDARVDNVKDARMTEITPNKDGIIYTAPTVADANHKITLPCGSIIKLLVHSSKKDKWIDTTLVIAPGYNNHGGICNQIGARSGDLHCRGGEVVKVGQVDKFMKSWIVQESENILLGKFKPITPPAANPGNICKLPEKPATVVPPPVRPTSLPPYVPPTTTSGVTSSVPGSTTTGAVITNSVVVTSVITTTLPASTSVVTQTVPGTSNVITTTVPGVSSVITSTVPATGVVTTTNISGTTVVLTTTIAGSSVVVSTTVPVSTVITTGSGALTTLVSTLVPGTTSLVTQVSTLFSVTTNGNVTPSTTSGSVPSPSGTTSGIPPPIYTVPPPPPSYTNQVDKHCRALFNVKGCNGLVDADFYIKACIDDATLTGSFVFSESSRLAFMTACHTTTQCMTQDVDVVIVERAVSIQRECGLGNNTCVNNCSGKGVCGNNGCRCEPGFGGVDCSISLTTLITYNPVSQQYAPNTDGFLLPIKQELPPVIAPIAAPGYSEAINTDQKVIDNPSYIPDTTSTTSGSTSGTNEQPPIGTPGAQTDSRPSGDFPIASAAYEMSMQLATSITFISFLL